MLTFYNERIANELFLRTARERDSLLRLTRLIGYRLRPGLAAQTLLSFALDAGAEARIRKGLKVMSVPGQDEKPQIFETIEQIVANAEINEAAALRRPFRSTASRLAAPAGRSSRGRRSLRSAKSSSSSGSTDRREKPSTALTRARGRRGDRFRARRPDTAIGLATVARAAKLEGRLRFFGHNAPQNVNVYVPAPTSTTWPQMGTCQTVDASLGPATTQLSARWTPHRYCRWQHSSLSMPAPPACRGCARRASSKTDDRSAQ